MGIFEALGAVVREAGRLERHPDRGGIASGAAGTPDAPPQRRHRPRPEPGMVPAGLMSPVVRP